MTFERRVCSYCAHPLDAHAPDCKRPSDPVPIMHPSLAKAQLVAAHYRAGLARIADAQSGVWGQWARETLDTVPDE